MAPSSRSQVRDSTGTIGGDETEGYDADDDTDLARREGPSEADTDTETPLRAELRDAPTPAPARQMSVSGGISHTTQPGASSVYLARDIDLGASSLWWKHDGAVPPAVQQFRSSDMLVEVEDESKRGGRMTRDVYILFHDYSQTIVTAQFSKDNPDVADLSQRHRAPPAPLSRDELEALYEQVGVLVARNVRGLNGRAVGDGSAIALVREALKATVPSVLPPVGQRSFGSLIYDNMANSSVQQMDEIRAGDVISFRNARFQGHKGGLHQKYSMDAGKPDHCGIVAEWEGNKRKVKVYEQGRDGRKVVQTSYRLGDLKSGQVRVWRVQVKSWVEWE